MQHSAGNTRSHRAVRSRDDFLCDYVKGKRVLHVGCADWPYTAQKLADGSLLHAKLSRHCRALIGCDLSADGVELMVRAGFSNIIASSLEEYVSAQGHGLSDVDVVIIGDVLEHVTNPGHFLSAIAAWKGPSVDVVITVPNAFCLGRSLQYAWSKIEPVHPDHVAYYSYSTLIELARRCGFSIGSVCYYGLEPGEKARMAGKWKLYAALDSLVMKWAPMLGEGLICVLET